MHARIFFAILPSLLCSVLPSLAIPIQSSNSLNIEARALEPALDGDQYFARDVVDESIIERSPTPVTDEIVFPRDLKLVVGGRLSSALTGMRSDKTNVSPKKVKKAVKKAAKALRKATKAVKKAERKAVTAKLERKISKASLDGHSALKSGKNGHILAKHELHDAHRENVQHGHVELHSGARLDKGTRHGSFDSQLHNGNYHAEFRNHGQGPHMHLQASLRHSDGFEHPSHFDEHHHETAHRASYHNVDHFAGFAAHGETNRLQGHHSRVHDGEYDDHAFARHQTHYASEY